MGEKIVNVCVYYTHTRLPWGWGNWVYTNFSRGGNIQDFPEEILVYTRFSGGNSNMTGKIGCNSVIKFTLKTSVSVMQVHM